MADPMCGNVEDIRNEFAYISRITGMEAREGTGEFGFPDLKELRDILKEVDTAPMERALSRPAGTRGRRPYPRGPIIRALLSMPVLGIADLSALHDELLNNPALRAACGFTTSVPSRPTLSRVFGRLGGMREMMEELLAKTAEKLAEYLPDLGREVAVDSTMVKTNSNRRREPFSDPEASWGWQHSAQSEKGWIWVLGYKVHLVADAGEDIPLAVAVTTGSQSDTTYLPAMVEEASPKPEVVIADRGYDSKDNGEWLHRRGIAPVIHKRKPKSGFHTRDNGQTYSDRGIPLCECGRERPYFGTDPETGVRVYGPVTDCERGGKFEGFSSCDFEVRVNPEDDIRLFGGAIRRDGPEWKMTYRKRWSVERVFSRWKERGVFESHSFRGLSRIRLLIQMYAITHVAARLAEEKNTDTLPMAA